MNKHVGVTAVTANKDIINAAYLNKSNSILYRFVKRLFDISFGLIGLIFLIPIAIIVKIMFLASKDYNSIFLVQKRIGKNGKEFNFYKFRSMVANADEVLERLLAENEELREEYQKNKKLKNDPRITKVGKIIRRTSLDEMPQLINILLGQMSLVGNRPYLPREKSDMGDYFHSIVATKPGLTGYWQVSGRSDLSFQRRLQLEKYYSEHCGITMDIKIFFKTFQVVLFGKGAK